MNSLFELDCLSELSYKGTKGLTSKPLVAYRVDGVHLADKSGRPLDLS